MKVRTTVEVAARVEAATVETAAVANAGEAAAALAVQQMGASGSVLLKSYSFPIHFLFI